MFLLADFSLLQCELHLRLLLKNLHLLSEHLSEKSHSIKILKFLDFRLYLFTRI